jgi:ATP-dependent DNA helicase RecG
VNNLSEKQIIILKAIHENQEVKKLTLQHLTDFSASAIDKNLEILKKIGLLEREGTKGGVWILDYINPKVSE